MPFCSVMKLKSCLDALRLQLGHEEFTHLPDTIPHLLDLSDPFGLECRISLSTVVTTEAPWAGGLE